MLERLRASVANYLATPGKTENLPTSDAAWMDPLTFASKDFPRYRPDDLVTWKGWPIYQKMMRDEQVKAVVRFRRDSITGRDWFFSFTAEQTEKLGEEEAARRISLNTHIVNQMQGSFSSRLNGIMSSQWAGFSMTDKVYQQIQWDEKTYWGIKHLRTKPFYSFEFKVDQFGNLDQIDQVVNGSRIKIDPSRMIYFVHNIDVDEQYGGSELEAAYRAWFCKDIIIKLQSIYLERYAGGFLVAQPKEGQAIRSGSPEYTQMLNVLKNLQTKSAILLPNSVDLELHSPSNTDAFERGIVQHDKGIAKALLVPNLLGISEQGANGSRSLGDTQLEAFLWMLDADAKRLEEALDEQLFKELGDANYGDNIYPAFRFKPISKAMINKVVTTWGELVQKGAVTSTDTDEAYIRDMMTFPQMQETEEGGESVNQASALNGAQVTSLVDVLVKVSEGNLPQETAIEVITSSFPITREKAEAMVSKIEVGGNPEDVLDDIEIDPDVEIDPDAEVDTDSNIGDEETILGAGYLVDNEDEEHMHVKAGPAFTKAARRVDFASIASNSTTIEWEGVDALAEAMDAMVDQLIDQIKVKDAAGTSADPLEAEKIMPAPSSVAAVRKALQKTLANSWALGETNAKREVKKAGFSKKMFASLEDVAAKYLVARSRSSAGKLTADTVSIIDNALLNSIKFAWPIQKTVESIYEGLASAGLISSAKAEAELGALLQTSNPQARLETTIRTTSFEALNEARHSFFTDASLGGFVQAYEYSAVLDSRTTEVCRALETTGPGAHIHPVGDEFWNVYRPLNHFNCRGILIPLTADDMWDETGSDVGISPQQGFGG